MSDPWVMASQMWLNNNYTGVSGFTPVVEDGVTGWEVVFGLTRALQYELGITSLSDNFGPTTLSALTAQVGNVTASTVNTNIVAIMQCGLWCKGYWGGDYFGDFSTADGLNMMLASMGLSYVNALPPKAFKGLLTMDSYILVSGGASEVQTAQRWLNQKYMNRADFFLMPCDGRYSRDVQERLMYAIQYEIGMADGVANGYFGPGTRQGLHDYGEVEYGNSDSTKNFVRLYQAALRFNGHSVPFDGSFGSTVQTATTTFQSFAELPTTGEGDFRTWASLLVSTGDINRAVAACDTSTKLDPVTADLLYDTGYRKVGRYINGTTKRLAHNEPELIWDAGLEWFPIYQEWSDSVSEFSATLGHEQGERIAIRMRQLGMSSGALVFVAVDYDATDDDIDAAIRPHFENAKSAIDDSVNPSYRLGVYGTRNVCQRLADEAGSASSFVAGMSTGYSGNLGFALPSNWAYDQILETYEEDGPAYIEIDRVVRSTIRAESIGPTGMKRTPRGATAADFDEAGFWKFCELGYLADVTAFPLVRTLSAYKNDFVLNFLQEPEYPTQSASDLWYLFTPPAELGPLVTGNASLVEALTLSRSGFYTRAGSLDVPKPASSLILDIPHFAASLRGYLAWGQLPTEYQNQCWTSDLGAWALDLVQGWADYEEARLASPGFSLDVRSWVQANIGNTASSFGRADLIADLAAYVVWRKLTMGATPPIEEAMRETLCAIEDDPAWLPTEFFESRFNTRANLVSAAMDVFTSTWAPTSRGRDKFLRGNREPGSVTGTNPPSGGVVATELEDLAEGFADVIEDAMTWS